MTENPHPVAVALNAITTALIGRRDKTAKVALQEFHAISKAYIAGEDVGERINTLLALLNLDKAARVEPGMLRTDAVKTEEK